MDSLRNDICHLYEIDSKTPLRMMKLTHTSVFPEVLLRQIVPLVCKVFDDKTISAFEATKDKLHFQPETVKLVTLITHWFKTMNVKDRYNDIKLRDGTRAPWSIDCDSLQNLESLCKVVATCRWDGTGNRCRKLAKFTADAFLVTTNSK